jgi:hypothetical protein
MPVKYLLVFLVLSLCIQHGFTQETNYSSPEEPYVQKAISELESALSAPEGSLYKFGAENTINGSFTFDLTIRNKGEMATVYFISSLGGTLKMQNMVKDELKAFRFSFKMPKGKSYKFQYTFQFN